MDKFSEITDTIRLDIELHHQLQDLVNRCTACGADETSERIDVYDTKRAELEKRIEHTNRELSNLLLFSDFDSECVDRTKKKEVVLLMDQFRLTVSETLAVVNRSIEEFTREKKRVIHNLKHIHIGRKALNSYIQYSAALK